MDNEKLHTCTKYKHDKQQSTEHHKVLNLRIHNECMHVMYVSHVYTHEHIH